MTSGVPPVPFKYWEGNADNEALIGPFVPSVSVLVLTDIDAQWAGNAGANGFVTISSGLLAIGWLLFEVPSGGPGHFQWRGQQLIVGSDYLNMIVSGASIGFRMFGWLYPSPTRPP